MTNPPIKDLNPLCRRRRWSGFRSWSVACFSVLIVMVTGCVSGAGNGQRASEDISAASFVLAAPSSSEPVTAAMICVPSEVRAGGTFEVFVRLAIAGAHHIYARTPEGSPFRPITLQMALPPGMEALGDWSGPEPSRLGPEEFVYTNSVLLRRRFKVGANIPVGQLSIQGELHYQACTDELCWPPGILPLSTSLRIVSPK